MIGEKRRYSVSAFVKCRLFRMMKWFKHPLVSIRSSGRRRHYARGFDALSAPLQLWSARTPSEPKPAFDKEAYDPERSWPRTIRIHRR